jgi:hypothetical protein
VASGPPRRVIVKLGTGPETTGLIFPPSPVLGAFSAVPVTLPAFFHQQSPHRVRLIGGARLAAAVVSVSVRACTELAAVSFGRLARAPQAA